jgi:CheY-like chemotaxis protein
MASINENELLDEIRYDIKVKDLLKARIVLSSLEHVSRNAQKQALFEVSRTDDDFAIPLLAGVIAKSPDVSESFPQIKETMFSKILDSPEILLDQLSREEDPLNKAFLAEVAGEIRLEKAAPMLIRMLTKEEDLKIIKSAIISLGMVGDPSAVGAVSEYMYVGSRDVVIASVRALGEMATPEAVQKLADRLGGDTDLDLMILNIIAKIQIPEALEKLNEILGSQFAHLRTAAKQKLSEIGVMSVRILTKNLLRDDPDLVIHSLNVLGDVGDSAAIPAIRKLLHNEPKDPNVRFAAYETLGRLPLDKGAYALAAGLADPVDNVRNAAAKAIDRNYNPVLAAGIRNLTRSGDAEAQKIMVIVINSQCDNVLLDLLEEDFFKGPAVDYLAGKAHPDIRSHYAGVFADAGYNDLAKQIAPKGMAKVGGKRKVFAVDDSRMILNIYRTMLHNLECESQLFEFPASALERIEKEKPDIILTDLNMPDITGIELTKGVRQWYTKEELPIIMVTTQDEARDKEAAYDAGVNGILQKPFTEEQIGKALEEFTR